jgi:hypothetical protein
MYPVASSSSSAICAKQIAVNAGASYAQRSTAHSEIDPQDVTTSKQGRCTMAPAKSPAFLRSGFPQDKVPQTKRLASFFDSTIFSLVAGERVRLLC